MKTVSWILLALVAVLLLLGSCASTYLAYFSDPSADPLIAGAAANLDPDVVVALQGRRGTAAALGLSLGTLLLLVVLGPYRQGERWAWWAILLSIAVYAFFTALRVVTLGTWLGVQVALIMLVVVFIALFLDLKRLSEPRR